MNNQNVEVIEMFKGVNAVQDFNVAIEVTVVLENFFPKFTCLREGDFSVLSNKLSNEFDGINCLTLALQDGSKIETELFDASIKATELDDSILTGTIILDLEGEGTNVDGAFEAFKGKFEGAKIQGFPLVVFDSETEEWTSLDVTTLLTKLEFELVEK